VDEGDAGTGNATFTVTLNRVSGRTVTVDYATVKGTATAPNDYAAATGTLIFAAGETAKTISVHVNGDVLDEANENFAVVLADEFNATIGVASGLGTITDDDPCRHSRSAT
jgi:hypothetical protein